MNFEIISVKKVSNLRNIFLLKKQTTVVFSLGEPFNDEEFQDFMTIALDDESNRVCTYKDFLQNLVVEDND